MRDPFAVVTSGRSGSLSLALALNQHPLLCVMHEPYRVLIQEAYKRVTIGAGQVGSSAKWFKNTMPRPAGPQRVGIVDQKLTFFVHDFRKAFPNSHFIHLLRDGRDVVTSGLVRGWYSRSEENFPLHPWAVYRLRADELAGACRREAEEWQALGPFGKNCWYWAFMVRTAREALTGLPVHVQRLEDLMLAPEEDAEAGAVRIWEALQYLQGYLQVQPIDLGMVHQNAGPEERVKRNKWAHWTEEQRELFEELCGAEMDVYYEGWREANGWQVRA